MSTYYYVACPKCKVKSIIHAQQAWGTWTKFEDNDFMEEHRDHELVVVDEHSALVEDIFYKELEKK